MQKHSLRNLPASVAGFFAGKRVLVTGGSGFIGSSLARDLVALGAHVTVLDAMLPLYGATPFNLKDVEGEVEMIEGDIRDLEQIKEAVSGKDIVYHLAAQVSYIDSKEKPFLDLDINGRGHLTVLEAMREAAPKAKMIFSSSRMVYGKIQLLPVTENHPTNPLSLYGIHKLLGEKYCAYYARTFGMDTLSVRIPNPYGPRQQMKHAKYSIVGWFLRQALEDKTIKIFGEGDQERDYLYIDDIVDAFLHLTVRGSRGEVYNVGTHERVTFTHMVDTILRVVGSGSKEYVPWPENYEKNETGDYIADTTKIEKATGWTPKVPLEEGITHMAEYYKKHGKHYW